MLNAAETALLESVPEGLFIGGEWRPATSGSTLKVYDPATGEAIKTIADASVDDGAAALDAAAESAPDWAKTSPRERAEILRRAFDLIQERQDQVALLMTLEMGNRWPNPKRKSSTAASFFAGSPRRQYGSSAATASTPRAPGG